MSATTDRMPSAINPSSGGTLTSNTTVIVALIPAHDEAERIGDTVRAVRALDEVDRIIVIDDGSRDETARIAEDAGAKVIRSTRNVGKGGALNAAASRCEDATIVLLLDGDLGKSAGEASKLIAPVIAGEADMTIATFPPATKAGFGLVKNLAAKTIARTGSDFVPQAPISGQRALSRECLDATLPFGSGYGAEVTLTVRALQAGFRILEVPTTMTHAATGRDLAGFIHRGRQYAHIWLASRRMR
jgi:glycosyltransferase involved in cell wall biosynthesis